MNIDAVASAVSYSQQNCGNKPGKRQFTGTSKIFRFRFLFRGKRRRNDVHKLLEEREFCLGFTDWQNCAHSYFVTICVNHRECLFGAVVDGDMQCSGIGNIAVQCWQQIPEHSSKIELDAYVLMPNHLHGILIIQSSDDNA